MRTGSFTPLGWAFLVTALSAASWPAGAEQPGDAIETEATAGSCQPGPARLCLNGGRFQVTARWRTPQGLEGDGRAISLTNDTGFFWFFNGSNVEVVLKVIDACTLNDRFWFFAAGLTNVRVDLTVTDTATGTTRTYRNPLGSPFQPIQDTDAFPTCGRGAGQAASPPLAATQAAAAHAAQLGELTRIGAVPQALDEQGSTDAGPRLARGDFEKGSCTASSTALCLNDQRFKVEARWSTQQGSQGDGRAVRITNDTGYFWFFTSSNVEMVVKVLDACPVNGRFWVFAAGLTNVRVELTVTDTVNGTVSHYVNPQSSAFQPIQDVKAFATCQGNLQPCTEQDPTREEIEAAVVTALSALGDPMGDVTDYSLAVRMTEARVGCELRTGQSSADLDLGFDAAKACGVAGVNYCGPGTSATNPFLGVVSVPTCLNEGCCQHDSCYGSQCVTSECNWTPQSQDCDDPLLAVCRGQSSCGFFQLLHPGALLVCSIAECLNGTPILPTSLPTCLAIRATRLVLNPHCRQPASLETCNLQCAGQTCSTFTGCNPESGCTDPVCGSITEGGGVCLEGATPCAGLASCTTSADCSGGLCLVDSCCVRSVCVNVSQFCPDIGADRRALTLAVPGVPTIGQP